MMDSSLVRRACSGLLLVLMAGCTSVEAVSQPAKYIAGKQPRSIWLTKHNQSVVRMDGPRMLGDTVIGSVNGEYTEVPLSDVTRVSAQQNSKSKTIVAGVLGGAAVAGALIVIFSHGGSAQNTSQQIADTMTLQRVF